MPRVRREGLIIVNKLLSKLREAMSAFLQDLPYFRLPADLLLRSEDERLIKIHVMILRLFNLSTLKTCYIA